MKESSAADQRKQHVFAILDQLKEQGERINADKVAKLAKMGKQTILPYYNEWRYLGAVAEEEGLELPEELVTTLKRCAAKWKQELGENFKQFEESANEEIEQLKSQLNEAEVRFDTVQAQLSSEQQANQALKNNIDDATQQLQNTKVQLQDMTQQLALVQQRYEQALAQIEEQKTTHQAALAAQEKQLDSRYQEQLNHWMTAVDEERRNKQQLDKQLADANQQYQTVYKEQLELQARFDFKSKAYLEACEARNQAQKELKQTVTPLALLQQAALLLTVTPDTLITALSELQTQAKQSDYLRQQHGDLQQRYQQQAQQLQQAQQKLDGMNQMALELERLKGAAEAFEKSLPKKQK